MKRVIFLYVLAISSWVVAEDQTIPYSQELWNQYAEFETVLVKNMDTANKKMSHLKSVKGNSDSQSNIVANWAKQRPGKSPAELSEKRDLFKELGKRLLECRNDIQAQQERMRTIQFVQTQSNELSPRLLEKALRRLTGQIERLITMENTLMKKMGLPVQKNETKKGTAYNPTAMLPGCPLCQLAGSPNGLPGHTNSEQSAILPDPNTFDSGLNP
jgi:hypothetical protein